jgi:hypothetical protein
MRAGQASSRNSCASLAAIPTRVGRDGVAPGGIAAFVPATRPNRDHASRSRQLCIRA